MVVAWPKASHVIASMVRLQRMSRGRIMGSLLADQPPDVRRSMALPESTASLLLRWRRHLDVHECRRCSGARERTCLDEKDLPRVGTLSQTLDLGESGSENRIAVTKASIALLTLASLCLGASPPAGPAREPSSSSSRRPRHV